MRTLLLLVICLLLLLLSVPASAQEVVDRGPVTATMKFSWQAPPNITNVADAQTFEWRVKDGAVPATALAGVTCSISNAVLTCQSLLGQSQADALNRVGIHSLTIASFRQDVGESQASSPFLLQSPAGAATAFRIIR